MSRGYSPTLFHIGRCTQMAEKNNAVCDVCGKGYYVCLSCSDAMKLHPFKSFTDTAEHFKVFQTVKGLLTGVYTKDEAREKFKNIDLSDLEDYREHIKTLIKDVLKEEKVEVVVEATEKIKNAVVEDVAEVKIEEINVEETEISEVIEEVVEDVVKSTVSRKRNYKVETE